ncbi:ABC transporter, ATP-binding protein [Lachnoanaerobaculum saburreum F0468]|jgi:macrolide export ATP-binding/permease protein macB|uniref:ABC transporter, ATP-binding protein n=1 Tax=Lachnoanaerobaculum saburreum F0468 TaxID=1095750 RepID=I0R8A4_9FIRM|nr:ATP-binding cassette domain-containing protein [Lachnoanaerobaculum saburreum]EIC95912.1 ABC transporter, ATP-binding protein [Lachnoanaerobaculum saburreum F0468]
MIEMIDIKKRYINSDKNIIDGCTAIFDIGKRYALFGENGSGKTTFVKILGLLDKNFSGTYRINGKEVLSMSGSDIARLRNEVFGFMFQDNKLLENESAYNNIFIPLIYSKRYRYFDRKKRVIEIAEILGIEKLLKKRVFQMSGGEKHLVALARAMVNDPSVLILDEPFSSLSIENRKLIMEYVDNIMDENKILVMVTHDSSIYSDKRYITLNMTEGKLSNIK